MDRDFEATVHLELPVDVDGGVHLGMGSVDDEVAIVRSCFRSRAQ